MNDFELELHCLESIVQEPWVVYAVNVVVISKYGDKRLVVEAHNEVREAEDEELALVEAVDGGEALALNGVVPGLSPRVELTAAVDSLPASVAAARGFAVTFAMFLC